MYAPDLSRAGCHFSLKLAALVLTAAVVIVCVAWSPMYHQAASGDDRPLSKDAAIERVEQLGGKVGIDGDLDDQPVWMVDLSNTQVDGAGLSVLQSLPHVEVLNLADSSVGDQDLKHLKNLSKLKELNLAGTRVTDLGMEALTDLKALKTLILNDTGITDRGLLKLVELGSLDDPILEGTQVTEVGRAQFRLTRDKQRSLKSGDPERGRRWNQLGRLTLMVADQNAAEQDRAVELLERAVLESPQNDEYKLDLADAYALLDLELTSAAATELYEEVLERRPDDEDLLGRLAKTYTALENVDRAFEYVDRRLNLVPVSGTYDVATQIVGIVACGGESESALKLMERAARKSPDDPRIQLLLGAMLAESGKPAESKNIAARVLSQFAPDHPIHEAAQSLLENLENLQ